MDKKALYNLLGKYLNNTCTGEEKKLIDDWLELLQENKAFATYSRDDLHTIHNRIWQKIQKNTYDNKEADSPVARKRSFLMSFSKWAVAASVAGIILFAGFRFLQKKDIGSPQNDFASIVPSSGLQKQTNSTSSPVKILLDDSSVVVLEPGATLNYPVQFSSAKREVYLEGKAFFDVSKNARRPFLVYHNNLVTHVLGTSFTIDTKRGGKQVEVSVLTGKVAVSENENLAGAEHPKANGVILTPNQKVIYAGDSRLFISSLVEKPVPVKTEASQSFDFENIELGQVLSAISKEYAIEIVAENEAINSCTFTGNIAKQDLYTKLDIICSAINADYELKGTKILIKGHGCE